VDLGEEGQALEYCHAIEGYLHRKADGHLIRIQGPSFDMVRGWAERGIPLKVAMRGIDRYFERYYAKGPRRHPVKIDFCEPDVLDIFDEWRRAVGVAATGEVSAKPSSLPAHLERVVARLTSLRAGADVELDTHIDAIVRELDTARAGAKSLRGAGRAVLLARLAELDAELLAIVRERLTENERDALRRDAELELAPFRARMPHSAFEQSMGACMDRLLRDKARLPILTLE
jgi:hypothetical protein